MAGNHHHLIDIAADANLGAALGTTYGGAAPVGGGGGNEKKWLRKLTSATVNTAVLRDLISRTPMLWYLGEGSGARAIFPARARRGAPGSTPRGCAQWSSARSTAVTLASPQTSSFLLIPSINL